MTFEIPALALSGHVLAHHVAPGTAYEDEPTQTIPAGWWVIGNNGDFEIHIGTIEDADGRDVSEQVATLLAAALEEASLRGSERI
jgi:hypothetical protein